MSMSRDELRRELENDGFHLPNKQYDDVHEQWTESQGGVLVRGFLLAATTYPDGTRVEKVLGRNIVVNSGLDNIARAIAAGYAGYTTYAVNMFAIGNAKAAESASVTALGNQIYAASPVVTFANTGKVTFTITLAAGASGWPGSGSQTLNEAGLQATGASPSLVTYKAFADQTKDATTSLDLLWNLTFSYAGSG